MIDHLSTYTTRFEEARNFYDKAFAPLGFGRVMEMVSTWDPEWPERRLVAWGPPGKACYWMTEVKEAASPRHVAFVAADRAAVEAFYNEALAAGGRDDGAPGPRPHYHENYYGAFVIDPDGNFNEAVCHRKP
jgi:catechol 2,3-dioxygenase-like lactoylglutathione lyase family enzyme